eukprot:3658114-Amphidinium_carterae.2
MASLVETYSQWSFSCCTPADLESFSTTVYLVSFSFVREESYFCASRGAGVRQDAAGERHPLPKAYNAAAQCFLVSKSGGALWLPAGIWERCQQFDLTVPFLFKEEHIRSEQQALPFLILSELISSKTTAPSSKC